MITKNRQQAKNVIRRLDEALQDIKKLVWPALGVADVIRFARFSPTWRPQVERAEVEVELTDEQYSDVMASLDEFYRSITARDGFDAARDREPIVNISSARPHAEGEVQLRGGKKLLDQFMLAAANLKLDKVAKRAGDDRVVVGGSAEQQKKAFTLFSAMKADDAAAEELASLSQKVVGLMQRMKDKSASPEEKKSTVADMKQTGAALKQRLDAMARTELSPEETAGFDEARSAAGGPAKYKIDGYFAPVCLAFATACRVRRGESASPAHYSPIFRTMSRSAFLEPAAGVPQTHRAVGLMPAEDAAAFMDGIRLTGDADEQTRWIIKICNDEMARSTPSAQEALRKNIEFEERKLRDTHISAEERAKAERALDGYRHAAERMVFSTADELDAYMQGKNIGFLARLYSKRLEHGRSEIKSVINAISRREELQKNLAQHEEKLAKAKDPAEKRDIRNTVQIIRMEIQRLAGAIPSDADGNASYDEKAERAKLPAELMQFKSLGDLENAVGGLVRDAEGGSRPNGGNPNLKTACARRRMKLFAAAEKRGATVYKCADWVLAALPTAQAAYPFGRYRPKVDARGNIIEECNLEDWEGITPENKRRRDSAEGAYIEDGLWRHPWETRWCTSAWNNEDNRQWGHREGPGNMFSRGGYARTGALIAFMDCKTGYLYQYGSGDLLDECDGVSGILDGIGSNMQRLLLKYPSLAKAMTDSGFVRYLRSCDKPKTPAIMLQQLMQSGRLTPSGSVMIHGPDDFENILPVIDMVDELKIAADCDAPEKLFDAARRQSSAVSMPVVDLGGVKKGAYLFKNLILSNSPLRLKNTSQLQNAAGMFKNLQFKAPDAEISGLDTKNVVNADEMFAQCRSVQARGVRIPELDFGQCVSMNNAFTSSGVMKITFKGSPDKVVQAVDAFQNCVMLETMPNVLFKSVKFGEQLVSGFKGDYSAIFDNCPKLTKKYRSQPAGAGKPGDKFDDRIDDIKAFYEDISRLEPMLDSRGYVIVKTSADAAAAAKVLTRRDVKGVVIDKNATSKYLFSDIEHLHIKSLDLNGRKDAARMFYGCTLAEFGEVIGSEEITDATGMFDDTTCGAYPQIRFPKCSRMTTFVDAHAPGSIPDIQYAPVFEEISEYGIDVVGDGLPPGQDGATIVNRINSFLFGCTRDEWANKHGAQRIAEIMYIGPLKSQAGDLMDATRKDKRGFAVVDTNTTPAAVAALIKAGIPGFVFDPEYVSSLNGSGSSGDGVVEECSLFRGLRAARMPIIDFNGLHSCQNMFRGCNVGQFAGFEGFDSVVDAAMMFTESKIQQVLPEFDARNVQNAQRMFAEANIGGFSRAISLPSAQFTAGMFANCTMPRFPFADDVSLPEVREAGQMFASASVGSAFMVKLIDMPKCESAYGMFAYCTALTEVRTAKIGGSGGAAQENCCDAMFAGCRALTTVGAVDAPRTPSAKAMFQECTLLKRVGTINMPAVADVSYMFNGDSGLLNVCQFIIPSTAAGANIFDGTALGARVYGKDGKALFARMRLLGR